MGADSKLRRAIKSVSNRALGDNVYSWLQAVAKAWDIRSGRWSEPELELIRFAVQEGETALDVGANYGVYAFHLDHAVGAGGHVYAFEPVPMTYKALQHVARLLRFRQVVLLPIGCGEENGSVSFTVPLQRNGALSAGQAHFSARQDSRPGWEPHVRWPESTKVDCPVVALDEWLRDCSRLSFVKCDVEGAELYVLRGARDLIAHHLPTVITEVNPWFLEGFDLTVRDLVRFFDQFGYDMFRFDERVRRLVGVEAQDVVEDNYVFVHPSRRERFSSLLNPS